MLFAGLDLNKTHGRPGYRLTDRLGIRGIVLLPLNVRLHIAGRHQSYSVAKLPEFSSPMVGGRAGFHPDQAGRLLREKRQQLAPR